MGLDVVEPIRPVARTRGVHEDDGHNLARARLDQRQRLEPLFMSPEATRKERDRVRLLNEDDLAREEVTEVDELRVSPDGLVLGLLERQPDVHAE